MKETFIIRTEWKDAILELKPEEQAIVLQNLFHYHSNNENLINLNNLSVKLIWSLIEPNLKRNISSYDKRKETSSENGKLGGRPLNNNKLQKPNNLITKPKKTKEPNESLSVTVTVTDSDNVKNNTYVGFISNFCLITGKKFKGDKKSEGQFNARIKEGYLMADILLATQNCFGDQYHKENTHHLTPEFITRPDKFQKYLNATPVSNNPQPKAHAGW